MTTIKSVETKNAKLTLKKENNVYKVTLDKSDKDIHETHVELKDALKTFDKYEKLLGDK